MTGHQKIEIENNKCIYRLDLEKKISVIAGMSATGKTTMIDLIQSYDRYGKSSGIRFIAEKRCTVLSGADWKLLLDHLHDSIVFIDDGRPFVFTAEFADTILNTDNYYVIITRQKLVHLPVDEDSIYELRMQKNANSEKTCNIMVRLSPECQRQVI